MIILVKFNKLSLNDNKYIEAWTISMTFLGIIMPKNYFITRNYNSP